MDETNDSDIYCDLPNFSYSDRLDKLQATNKCLNEEIAELNDTLVNVTKEKDEYQTKCATLTKNISSLLKTAQAEIQRKDKLINELRTKIAEITKQNQNNKNQRSLLENEGNHQKRGYNNETNHFKEDNNVSNKNPVSNLEKISNEITNISSENKTSPITLNSSNSPSNITDSRSDKTSKLVLRNDPSNIIKPNLNVTLPSGQCKTLYSQRMLKRIQGINSTNDAVSGMAKMESKENRILSNETNWNNSFSSKNSEQISTTISKPSEDLIDSKKKPTLTTDLKNNINDTTDKNCSTIAKNIPNNEENKQIKTITNEKYFNSNFNVIKRPLQVINEDKINEIKKNEDKLNQTNETREEICKEKLVTISCNDNIKPNENKNNDSSQFLRPVSSLVIKKPFKKILPVSNNWNGLVKTVDNVNINDNNCRQENIIDNSLVMKNSKENEKEEQDQQNNLMEHLFGSPLKWTENSNESVPHLELTSPTVYEDSCSAHIENAKFNVSTTVKPLNTMNSTQKNNTIKEETCNKLNDKTQKQINIQQLNKTESLRAFEEVGINNKQNIKSIFSPLKTDSCKSISGVNLSRDSSSIDLTINFPFKSKYEDSVLGQFDDTTQFVSALTKVQTKISPLNTPVKSVQNKLLPIISTNVIEQAFNKEQKKPESSEVLNVIKSNNNEKPVNILYPRKTPRIVTYNKDKEQKQSIKPSSTVNDTPTKCNRFAINDAFISQQEEKVLRNSKTNINDPIAITICAKNKNRNKDNISINQNLQPCSPKKQKTSPNNTLSPRKQQNKRLGKLSPVKLADNKNLQEKQTSIDCQPVVKDSKTSGFLEKLLPDENRLNSTECVNKQALITKQDPRTDNKKMATFNELSMTMKRNTNDLNETKGNTVCNRETVKTYNSGCNKIISENGHINKSKNNQQTSIDPNCLPLKRNSETLRHQHFKPSSQLKRTTRNLDIYTKSHSYNKTYQQRESPEHKRLKLDETKNKDVMTPRKSTNIIVRTSKKPEFVSTTLLDDYTSTTVIKSSEVVNNRHSDRGTEMREWVLKPITFDSDRTSLTRKHNSDTSRYSGETNIRLTPKGKVDSRHTSYTKRIINGRRPLKFGVKVTLD